MAIRDLADADVAGFNVFARDIISLAEDERPDTLIAKFQATGNGNSRTFQVPFDRINEALLFFLGFATFTDGEIVRHQPVRDPVFRNHFAVRAEVRAVGQRGAVFDPTSTPLYTANKPAVAYITVYFETLRYDVGTLANPETSPVMRELSAAANESMRYTIKDVSAARETYSALTGTFVWADGSGNPDLNNTVQTGIPIQVTYNDIRLALVNIPYDAIPITAINNCMGKVNASTVTMCNRPPPLNYDPETLLLISYTIADGYFADGTRAAALTYFFRWRQSGWNTFLNPKGEFRRVWRKATQALPTEDWKGIYLTAKTAGNDDFPFLFRAEGA